MDQRLLLDLAAAALLALTALAGAYAPVWLSGGLGGRGVKRGIAYSIGNMVSAGVMVSAGFCHLLADAERRLHSEGRFPLAPFLCALGFLLTLFADQVATNLSTQAKRSGGGGGGGSNHRHHRHRMRRLDHESDPGDDPGGSPAAVDDCCATKMVMMADLTGIAPRPNDKPPTPPVAGAKADVRVQGGGPGALLPGAGGAVDPDGRGPLERVAFVGPEPQQRRNKQQSYDPVPALDQDDLDIVVHSSSGNGNGAAAGMGVGASPLGNAPSNLSSAPGTAAMAAAADEELPLVNAVSGLLHLDDGPGPPPPGSLAAAAGGLGSHSHAHGSAGGAGAAGGNHGHGAVSFITAVLMGIALCFHSLLEGAAMGAERTVSDTLHIFIAIVAHKGLAAYALGSSLVDSKANARRFWAVILFFVFATPVGILLGYLVSEVADGDGTASISALAAGTFLYVAAMEVIPKELSNNDRWFVKLVALMLGFGAMSLLAIWA